MGAYKDSLEPDGPPRNGPVETELILHPGIPELSDKLIQLKQPPEIAERFILAREWIMQKAESALSLPCTELTLGVVKARRAELNRIREDLDAQWRDVESAVMAPLLKAKALYKEFLRDVLSETEKKLKSRVEFTTAEIKRPCEEGLRAYFDELCAVHHIDFIRYEQTGVVVDMASARQKTPKKLRERLASFVENVAHCVESVADMEDADEILAEYRQSLDLAAAIGAVKDRRRRVEEARAASEAIREAREREAEMVRRVEMLAPPVVVAEQKILTAVFTVRTTKERMIKLREFMKSEGITYEC